MSVMRFLLAAAVIVATMLASVSARADEEAARAHFKKGVGLYDGKHYAEALEEFKAAYAEKPSGGIKQNVALCLQQLGRSIEAATAFDEALDEGETTLKPETKAAIQRELGELEKVVATVHMHVLGADNRPLTNAIVTVDGAPLSATAARRPIRLQQGIHTFTAHVDGIADPPPKKLALLLGQPVDATFIVAGTTQGGDSTLTVKTNSDDATIKIDGKEVGTGAWTGKLAAGSHELEVSAPDRRTATIDVTVPAGATIEYPITLTREGEPPGPYDHVDRKAPAAKKLYIVPSLALDYASYRFSPAAGETTPEGTRRGMVGAALGIRGGIRVNRWIGVELGAEVGLLGAKYKLNDSDARETQTTIGHFQLVPAFRLVTPGKVRFTAATGIGLHGLTFEEKVPVTVKTGDDTKTIKGSGVAFALLLDAGIQADVGPVFLEGVLFFDVHGVGPVRDTDNKDRLLESSPATRVGLRIGLGIPF